MQFTRQMTVKDTKICGCLNQLHVNATTLKFLPSLVCTLGQNETNDDGQDSTEKKKRSDKTWQEICL